MWSATVEFPLFREVKFKFGNDAATAQNSGYEGPGQPDRSLLVDAAELSYTATYDFITATPPDAVVEGTVRAGGTPVAGAKVGSSTDPNLYYALTFADGSYTLPFPSGTTTDLTVSAAGYDDAARTGVVAPASGVDFSLSGGAGLTYTIDGNLADWTDPRAELVNSPNGYDGGFGPDNLLGRVLVDWDDTNLYLAYDYRSSGNSAIVHLDLKPGGSSTAERFSAWPRLVTFDQPIDFFLAQYEGQAVQLRAVVSETQADELDAASYQRATGGAAPAYATEVAVPWTVLGYSGPPTGTLNLYGGVYGGDGYGAGDIVPHTGSDPAVTGNTVSTGATESRRVTFGAPFAVALTP